MGDKNALILFKYE